ncbi:MAG: protein-export chaperone SecB [Rhodobacteraceae bacterium]|nr:protein-export chaperone SecB [Paracoccaceae bacterium]
MSDTPTSAPSGTGQTDTIPMRFRGQYVRDLSFEIPHAPEIFQELRENPPEIPISLEPSVRHLADNTYEVTLTANIEAKVGSRVAFILELAYAATVDLDPKAIPQEHIHPVLLIEVPRFLFPFVRHLVSETTVRGGFPPLMLQLIDFADMYRRRFGDQPQTVARAESQTKH